MSNLVLFLQQTFQAVLSTDGRRSFAILIYENPTNTRIITTAYSAIAGFNAGDQLRSATVLSGMIVKQNFGVLNVFRIDGESALLFLQCAHACTVCCTLFGDLVKHVVQV